MAAAICRVEECMSFTGGVRLILQGLVPSLLRLCARRGWDGEGLEVARQKEGGDGDMSSLKVYVLRGRSQAHIPQGLVERRGAYYPATRTPVAYGGKDRASPLAGSLLCMHAVPRVMREDSASPCAR